MSPSRGRIPAYDRLLGGIFAAAFGLMIALLIVSTVSAVRQFEQPLTLCYKEPVATDRGDEYRVHAVEGIFVMKDSPSETADAYTHLLVPSQVNAELKGVRVPALSRFPLILDVTYVKGSADAARTACIAEGLIVPDLG